MRTAYTGLFENAKELHCQLVNRIVQGNTIIDQESVTGVGNAILQSMAVYVIENGKIQKVYFIQ
jgi:hypothetical protein